MQAKVRQLEGGAGDQQEGRDEGLGGEAAAAPQLPLPSAAIERAAEAEGSWEAVEALGAEEEGAGAAAAAEAAAAAGADEAAPGGGDGAAGRASPPPGLEPAAAEAAAAGEGQQ
jgi:hypothetical protein